MKNAHPITSVFLAMSLFTCQDSRDAVTSPSETDFYKTVGEEIPFETGMQWIDYYQDQNNSSGRASLFENYEVSAGQVESILSSVSNVVGVAFHYGTDVWGTKHIILIPVETSLSLWSSIPGRIYVDANSGNTISQSTAQSWATNYKNAHPSDIWFHFFGANIFDDIQAVPYFEHLDIEPGINVLNLTPQLLLVVWNEDLILGRSQDEEGRTFDASNPCPPCGIN